MKSSPLGVLRLLGFSRIVRPVLDCTMLALCLLSYVLIQEHTRDGQTNNPAHLRLSNVLAQQAGPPRSGFSISSIDQQFKLEPEMWTGFQGWLAENSSSSGHCSFSVLPAELPYRMQCTGSQHPTQTPATQLAMGTMPAVLIPGPIAAQSRQAKTETKSVNKQNAQKQLTVQGWVDTSQGRKHFDPKNRQWNR